jgi:glyoxylase-like metal-dependent hydrolase (beta-lactamase superfamily II)
MSVNPSRNKIIGPALSTSLLLAPMRNYESLKATGAVRVIDRHSSFFAIDFEQDNPEAGILLIDGGVHKQAKELKIHLAKRGLGLGAVRAFALTHGGHFDHKGALHVLPSSVRTIMGEGDIDAILGLRNSEGLIPGTIDRARSLIKRPPMGVVERVIPEIARNRQEFHFGELAVTALEMPGHTRGSMGYLVRRGAEDQPTDFFPGDSFDFKRNGRIRDAAGIFTGDRALSVLSKNNIAAVISEMDLVYGEIAPSHSGVGKYDALIELVP